MLLDILACFLNVLRVHCFVRGSHRFTAIECWLLAKSWEYEYLISFRLSDMFRQIIDGKALADVMETWRMWVTLSLKLVTLKIWKLIAIAGCVVFKKIQHENRKCQKSYVVWFWFFRSNKRDALHTNFFCCCLPYKESVSGRSLSSCLSRPDPVVAWYLDSNFPTVLQMTYKYGADFETAVLANANCGGENVARGCFLFVVPEWQESISMTWYELDMMILCIPVAYSL